MGCDLQFGHGSGLKTDVLFGFFSGRLLVQFDPNRAQEDAHILSSSGGTHLTTPSSGRGENSGFNAAEVKSASYPTTPHASLLRNLRPNQSMVKAIIIVPKNKNSTGGHCKTRYDSQTMLEIFLLRP